MNKSIKEIFETKEINFKRGKLLSGIIYPEFFPINENETVLNIGCGDGVQSVIYEGKFKRMIGVDINEERLETASKLMGYSGINNFKSIQANIEKIPLNEQFDKIIAIDSIEHVIYPNRVVDEMHRLLKDNGNLLITFPAMHDKWENLFRFIGRKILKRKGKTIRKEGWNPDAHQYDYKLSKWIDLLEKRDFELIDSRASTLFPPLHYLGLPRFWFSNKFIHTIDNFLCKLPIVKNYGQALVCNFKKNRLVENA